MDTASAIALAGLGGIGLYVLGGIAIEQKRLTRAGHKKVDEVFSEHEASSLSDDLIAFGVSMVMLGVVFDQTIPLYEQARALLPP